jgi:thioester reductase-like protein
MAYHFLSGGTGLVGRYLLREFMSADLPVAVLVRPDRFRSGSDRIEAIMQQWETVEHRRLPRPIVLEGELTSRDLGLSTVQKNWISRNCETVVHSAAAMVFKTDEHGEPHRTNVQGMRNLLDCCRELGICRFHHVSTAYICGLRQGRVYENELDVGQSMGNVYEESKIEAEKMLRASDWLRQVTVFRPSSIIGDSKTGFTSNFHGFYLPLQLAFSFASAVPPEEMNDRFLKRLGLAGDEGKNFVPVDWIASAIAYVVLHPEHHGRTYHLASPKPVSVRLLQSVVREAIRRYCKRTVSVKANSSELDIYEKLFHDRLLIYRSHWRDDPIFDLSNTQSVLGHMPCPDMDFDLLLRVSRWPVENNFTSPKKFQKPGCIDTHSCLAPWLNSGENRAANIASQKSKNGETNQALPEPINLQISGSGGGQWQLLVRNGELVGAERGLAENGYPGLYLNSDTLAALVASSSTVEQSIRSGRLVIEGPSDTHPRLIGIMKTIVANNKTA